MLVQEHYVLLQRNLLYTAITRGCKLAVLAEAQEAISTTIKQIDPHRRVTLLNEQLQQ